MSEDKTLNPKRELVVMGEKWDLVKSATDSTTPFAYERLKVENFACERLNDKAYIVLVGAYIPPMPNSIETPVRIMMVGFSNRQVVPLEVGPQQLRNMHIYKSNSKDIAKEFAMAFFGGDETPTRQAEITPYPEGVASDDGRSE